MSDVPVSVEPGTSITYVQPIRYVFAWHALTDACPKCRHLAVKEWTDQDLFHETLWDPIWGDIWDFIEDHTLAHPNCRCQLEVRVIINWNEVPEIQELKTVLEETPSIKIGALQIEEFTDLGQIQALRDAVHGLNTEISGLTMSYHALRELETTLFRTLWMLERSTGSKEVQAAINSIQRLMSIMRMAQFTIHAFEIASGPLGWLLFGITAASTLVSFGTFMQDVNQELTGH